MVIKREKNNIVVEEVKCLNLELTLDCGQAFRWVQESDGSWSGVVNGVYLNILQDGEKLIFKNTTDEDFENIWKPYFDLNRDYEKICEQLKEDELIRGTIDEYYGIRILRQDSWETLVSFVISQQNNIKRIKGIIERLCSTYGERLESGYYSFPTPEALARLSVEDFQALGTGYRAKYLESLAKNVYNGKIDLELLKGVTYDEVKKALLQIYGVGEKVAQCTLLFGFGFDNAYPIDVWMRRVMEHYPNGIPECFKGIEGIAQQYLFHWARNNL